MLPDICEGLVVRTIAGTKGNPFLIASSRLPSPAIVSCENLLEREGRTRRDWRTPLAFRVRRLSGFGLIFLGSSRMSWLKLRVALVGFRPCNCF